MRWYIFSSIQAIGVTQKSTEEIKTINEGIAVEIIHFVGDGFWNLLYHK